MSDFPAGETPQEHLRNALQLLHNLRTHELSSAEAVRCEATLNGITRRLAETVRQLEGRMVAR